jgi:uncharacterized protein YndB with AHSA1/START domain
MKVTKSILVKAPVEQIWKALTEPEIIKLYLFGTSVITDWKEGSKIIFKGNWHGTPFEDKGKVVSVEVNYLLRYTYWSSVLGIDDVPENYTETTYILTQESDHVLVNVTQSNLQSQPKQVQDYAANYWEELLNSLKKIVEAKNV